ncbi:spermatogenesis-associated protein 22-like isoform X2 [Artemia franciscana]|uniref:Uncharacterized protein n=2 Tax=Artemia franciscana TaxID=6661 RepID=A0AA88HN82_ARTSF|nr:hypothetical protein QYM36_013726 [Artemia franciscana]KAK2710154.1 hypothetical protein QYM36_013726 [Artemia franciscana]
MLQDYQFYNNGSLKDSRANLISRVDRQTNALGTSYSGMGPQFIPTQPSPANSFRRPQPRINFSKADPRANLLAAQKSGFTPQKFQGTQKNPLHDQFEIIQPACQNSNDGMPDDYVLDQFEAMISMAKGRGVKRNLGLQSKTLPDSRNAPERKILCENIQFAIDTDLMNNRSVISRQISTMNKSTGNYQIKDTKSQIGQTFTSDCNSVNITKSENVRRDSDGGTEKSPVKKKRSTPSDVRVLTSGVSKAMEWSNKKPKNCVLVFEIFGILSKTVPIISDADPFKFLLIDFSNGNVGIRGVYYPIDRKAPEIPVGTDIRCVGRFVGRVFQCFSVRRAEEGIRKVLPRLQFMSMRCVSKLRD